MTPIDLIYKYVVRIVVTALCLTFLTGSVLLIGLVEQQYNEPYQREVHCINAVCEKPCEDIKKFKRHEGCIK